MKYSCYKDDNVVIKSVNGLWRSVIHISLFLFSRRESPLVDEGLLVVMVSRSYSVTAHSVGLFWVSDQADTEIPTWQHTAFTSDISLPPVGFEPAVPANEKPPFQKHTQKCNRRRLLRAVSHVNLRKTVKLNLHLLFSYNIHINVIACLQLVFTCKL